MAQGAPVQRVPTGESRSPPSDAPTKQNLATWWKQFKKGPGREEKPEASAGEVPPPGEGIFGVPLQQSIRYANVAISLLDSEGNSFIYGYVPIVVAKCGVFLKEKATDIEGIFRLAGAERRIRQLQAIFNSPDRYGKGLDWTGYTVHDAANILRRYLNQLPEPIIPLDFYWHFREPLRHHQAQAVGEMDHQEKDVGGFDEESAIKTYQKLITELPTLNRQLLLYILDLLAVFASKSDLNRMTAPNLAAIFQPGLLSHPEHQLHPHEYRLSQDVLIFLIENQDHFLVGMQGTGADEKTIQDVQSGAPAPVKAPSSPGATKSKGVGRSASNASAGADSARRFAGVRRNVSTSSKQSRQSNHTPSPVTPPPSSPFTPAKSGGIHRSNTVPSKKSPALSGSDRFTKERMAEGAAAPAAVAVIGTAVPETALPGAANEQPSEVSQPRQPQIHEESLESPGAEREVFQDASEERQPRSDKLRVDMPASSSPRISPSGTPSRERTISSFFRSTSHGDGERKDVRRPNKLQKRRPEQGALSGQSSTASLGGTSHPSSPGHPPQTVTQDPPEAPMDGQLQHGELDTAARPANTEVAGENTADSAAVAQHTSALSEALKEKPNRASGVDTLKPSNQSPRGSMASHSTNNDEGVQDVGEAESTEKKKRWRFSRSHRESKSTNETGQSNTLLGSLSGAERSASSVGSTSKPQRSTTDELNTTSAPLTAIASGESDSVAVGSPPEKKGPLGWFKGKLQERKEREAEKERAKSPPPAERQESKGSFTTAFSRKESTTPSVEPDQAANAPETPTATQMESAKQQ